MSGVCGLDIDLVFCSSAFYASAFHTSALCLRSLLLSFYR
jgi:hypothetical protein